MSILNLKRRLTLETKGIVTSTFSVVFFVFILILHRL